jgi:hypothetical protein
MLRKLGQKLNGDSIILCSVTHMFNRRCTLLMTVDVFIDLQLIQLKVTSYEDVLCKMLIQCNEKCILIL